MHSDTLCFSPSEHHLSGLNLNKKIIDISRRITADALVYPGDPALEMSSLCEIDSSSPCKVTKLGWTTHFLTHLDLPSHFIAGGHTLDDISLERFVSDALVIEVNGDVITTGHIPVNIRGKSLLYKTRNSLGVADKNFDHKHVYMNADAARTAVERGANLIGIDYISIDKAGDESYPVHYVLLGSDVLILEGLDLSNVEEGAYTLSALPLKIAGADGSPVRAVLMSNSTT